MIWGLVVEERRKNAVKHCTPHNFSPLISLDHLGGVLYAPLLQLVGSRRVSSPLRVPLFSARLSHAALDCRGVWISSSGVSGLFRSDPTRPNPPLFIQAVCGTASRPINHHSLLITRKAWVDQLALLWSAMRWLSLNGRSYFPLESGASLFFLKLLSCASCELIKSRRVDPLSISHCCLGGRLVGILPSFPTTTPQSCQPFFPHSADWTACKQLERPNIASYFWLRLRSRWNAH